MIDKHPADASPAAPSDTSVAERVRRLARSFSAEWCRPDAPEHATERLVDTLSTAMLAFHATARGVESRALLAPAVPPEPVNAEKLHNFGELLQEELTARGWTMRDVAVRLTARKQFELDTLLALAAQRETRLVVPAEDLRELEAVFGVSEGLFSRLLAAPAVPSSAPPD